MGAGGVKEEVVDFETAGPQPLRLKRYYSATSAPGYYLGDASWRFDFEYSLLLSSYAATLLTPKGETYQFVQNAGQWAIANNEGPISLTGSSTGPYTVVLTDGTTITFVIGAHLSRYKISTITRPDGLTLTFSYVSPIPASDAIASITDNYGRSFSFTNVNSSASAVASIVYNSSPSSAPAFEVNYGYSSQTSQGFAYNWALTSATRLSNPSGSSPATWSQVDSVSYLYENTALPLVITGAIDERGIRNSTWSLDATGRALSSTLAGGLDSTSVTYNDTSPNYTQAVTNSLGKLTTYSFNAQKGLMLLGSAVSTASANTPASTRSVTYDSNSNIAQQADEESRVIAYTRDTYGRPTQMVRGSGTPLASTRNTTWNPTLGLPTQMVDPGLTTSYVWTAGGQLTSLTQTDTTTQTVPYSTNGQTRTWTYAYNSNGALTSVTDPVNAKTTYAYNATGALQSITDPLNHVTTVSAWNFRGQPTSLTDPNGVISALTYDGDGRLTGLSVDTAGMPATMTIAYDAAGDITKITDPIGAWTSFTYDNARRLTGMSNADGETATYVRDVMGNATSVTLNNSSGATVFSKTQVFDELGRLIKSIGVASQTYAFGYDRTNNNTTVTDPTSKTFSDGFDALNRLISQTNEDNATVTLTRSPVDDITGYSDPRSLTTTYVRNGFGEVIQEVSPDRGTLNYQRDVRGLVTQRVDARGVTLNTTYDLAGRILSEQNPALASDNIGYVYDQAAPGSYPIGHLTTASDAFGEMQRFYDQKGYISQEARQTGAAPSVSVAFSHDLAGNLTQMVMPSGRHITWSRDAMGRVTQVAVQGGAGFPNQVNVAGPIVHYPYGRPSSLIFGNHVIETYGVDSDYRVTSVELQLATGYPLVNRTLAWTGEELTSIADAATPANSEAFTYTPSHRLASAKGRLWNAGLDL